MAYQQFETARLLEDQDSKSNEYYWCDKIQWRAYV